MQEIPDPGLLVSITQLNLLGRWDYFELGGSGSGRGGIKLKPSNARDWTDVKVKTIEV